MLLKASLLFLMWTNSTIIPLAFKVSSDDRPQAKVLLERVARVITVILSVSCTQSDQVVLLANQEKNNKYEVKP